MTLEVAFGVCVLVCIYLVFILNVRAKQGNIPVSYMYTFILITVLTTLVIYHINAYLWLIAVIIALIVIFIERRNI